MVAGIGSTPNDTDKDTWKRLDVWIFGLCAVSLTVTQFSSESQTVCRQACCSWFSRAAECFASVPGSVLPVLLSTLFCRYRSALKTIRLLRQNKMLMSAVPRVEPPLLPARPIPVVVEEEEEERELPPKSPLRPSTSARSPSKKLWKGLQQLQQVALIHRYLCVPAVDTEDEPSDDDRFRFHMFCLVRFYLDDVRTGLFQIQGSSFHQVRPEPSAADQSRKGGRLLPGQDDQRDV